MCLILQVMYRKFALPSVRKFICIITVSYTHLDVYKRQVLVPLQLRTTSRTFYLNETLRVCEIKQDVYKRQI